MKNNANLKVIVANVIAEPNADTYSHIMLSGNISVIGSINRPAINTLPIVILFKVFFDFVNHNNSPFVDIKRINASSD